jgi:catalase
MVSDEATVELANDPAARDFVSDAFAHSQFIVYVPSVLPLLKATLGDRDLDAGFVRIERAKDVTKFVEDCQRLRFWERTTEPATGDKKTKLE